MQPKISIIMPVLNRKETIEKALRSVFDQQYATLEFIIIDGGSTDGTLAIIHAYQEKISYFHSRPDRSPADAVNVGIQKATGDLIGLLMADDWYEAGLFDKVAEAYASVPDADMYTCGGRIAFYDAASDAYKTKACFRTEDQVALTIHNVCFDIAAAMCCRFIKKSLYDRLGLFIPFDKNGGYMLSNDKVFLLKAIFTNAKNQYVDCLGHTSFANPKSSTFGGNYENILRLCREHMNTVDDFLMDQTLTARQRAQLIYWYNDQSARLILYKLLEGSFKEAWLESKAGFKKYPARFTPFFTLTVMRILFKQTKRAINRFLGKEIICI